jgi:hypothetical protein
MENYHKHGDGGYLPPTRLSCTARPRLPAAPQPHAFVLSASNSFEPFQRGGELTFTTMERSSHENPTFVSRKICGWHRGRFRGRNASGLRRWLQQ